MNNDYLINKQIKNNNVRISGEKELMTINKAIDLASSQGADLIQIAERDGVSICVVEELSKYIYQQKKKNKNKEKSKPKTGMKEMKIGLNTSEHDLLHKANKTKELMDEGYHVRVSMFLSGREIIRSNEGFEAVNKFIELCNPCICDKHASLNGKIISAVIFKK